jgi:hypothetical protein
MTNGDHGGKLGNEIVQGVGRAYSWPRNVF